MKRPGSAAASGDHCRSVDGGGKADPPAGPGLTHEEGCARTRAESYDVSVPRLRLGKGRPARGVVTVTGVMAVSRCIDCGSGEAWWRVPPPRIELGTEEWHWAWQWYPGLLVEQLTPAELQDPALNPMHPEARHDLQPISDLTRLLGEQRARGPRYPHMERR